MTAPHNAPLHASATPLGHDQHDDEYHDDIIHPDPIPFALVHVVCLAAIWTGVTAEALVICVVLYVTRMFGVTAGYHRYFSHRSFRTSRVGQFLLALLAQSTAQRGALWWAAKHRHHHKHSDTEHDVHSPRHRGFWYSHMGWIFSPQHTDTDYDALPDLTKFPELVWLNRHEYVSAAALAVGAWLVAGWSGLIVGFFWSTVLVYHGTFMINSLAHVHGKQRYVTGDDSRNNWWLAVITLGEGWHNNHHAYMASTRQGFRWWEVDITFYVLKALSWVRVVWDLNAPPEAIVRNEKKLGRGVVEKVARQLAASFPVDQIVARTREAWAHGPWPQAEAALAELHLPHVPTVEELRQRARQMYAASPSLDDIARRAREIIVQSVQTQLAQLTPPTTASAQ
ncbi:MAG TPA: fatty acid desaturase [Gemmatimonadaceae bacterium]|nr:fatty acid desaturase [Gemmatimonadaceae bacterium]